MNPENSHNKTDLIIHFKERWIEASGEYIPVASKDEFPEIVAQFLKNEGISRVITNCVHVSDEMKKSLAGQFEAFDDVEAENFDRDIIKDLCNRADAGITGVDALISDTGTLVIASNRPGNRLISSLPSIHLVIAFEIPIYTDLTSYLTAASPECGFNLITGPSRTADIEKKLVLGAHGPRRVVLFGPDL